MSRRGETMAEEMKKEKSMGPKGKPSEEKAKKEQEHLNKLTEIETDEEIEVEVEPREFIRIIDVK